MTHHTVPLGTRREWDDVANFRSNASGYDAAGPIVSVKDVSLGLVNGFLICNGFNIGHGRNGNWSDSRYALNGD